MRSTLLLLLLLLLFEGQSSAYDQSHTLNCSQINNDWTTLENLTFVWNIIELPGLDRYLFLIACPIVILLQMLLIVTMFKYKLYNHSPEDVIFSLIIIQAVASVSLFVTAMYDTYYRGAATMPTSFLPFCLASGVVNSSCTVAECIYFLFFLFHVIFNVNKSIKQTKWLKGKFKHFICLTTAIGLVVMSWRIGWIGLGQLGICELTQTSGGNIEVEFPIFQLVFGIIFVIFALFTYWYFRTHMPKISALNRRKMQQNVLIARFTIGMSTIQGLFCITKFILYQNCQQATPNHSILIFASIFNITRIFEFFYFMVMMLLYKKIGNKVKKLVRSLFSRKKWREPELERRDSKKQLFSVGDVGLREKILDILQEDNQIDFMKITQIMTMLTGIRTAYREYITIEDSPKPIKNLHYHEELSFRVDSKWVADYEQQALLLPRLSFLDAKFTIYSPHIFKHLLKMDNVDGIDQSFDLIRNSERLYKICEGSGGGRSGQFFFFSIDNKYILKTVPKQQFQNLQNELSLFYYHFRSYPKTLISKFYGMFKIEYTQIYQVYYILLMKNVSGCKKQQIKCIYDMKGSTDDRRALKDTKQLQDMSIPTPTVFKDLDFLEIEHKIFITNTDAHEVKSQLKVDTIFLRDLNIIDYSLLVMKIEWESQPVESFFWSQLQRLPSNTQENIFYHISLIDFSQKWDIKKQGQNWWKKILGKKDTSAQQPSFYQARFMNFIREITTFGLTEQMKRRETNIMALTPRKQQKYKMNSQETELQDFREVDLRTKSEGNQKPSLELQMPMSMV